MIKLVVLIGNICSGKTTIAKLLEPKGFRFFPVEDVKKQLDFKKKKYDKNQDKLYQEYAKKIVYLGKKEKLIIEATGANKFWPTCFETIKKEFGSKMITIMVATNPEICLSRLKNNNLGHRLNTRKELIEKINQTLNSNKSFDLFITNNGTEEEFVQSTKKILSKLK